jgi:hypothetical protein
MCTQHLLTVTRLYVAKPINWRRPLYWFMNIYTQIFCECIYNAFMFRNLMPAGTALIMTLLLATSLHDENMFLFDEFILFI